MTVDIQLPDLVTPVAASLGHTDFEVMDWTVQRLSGGLPNSMRAGLASIGLQVRGVTPPDCNRGQSS